MQTDAEVAAKAWRPPNTFLLDNDQSPLSSQPVSLGFRRIRRVAQHLKQENAK